MSDLQSALAEIQKNLKAPKGQWNDFSKYNYRSCEDILEGLKPLLGACVLTLSDDITAVVDRVYVKATATISLGSESISTTAFAREELTKKGMDAAQITGSASSYARKYALNGLLCIDDEKDPDNKDNRVNGGNKKNNQNQAKNQSAKKDKPWLNSVDDNLANWIRGQLAGGYTHDQSIATLRNDWAISKAVVEQIKQIN